MAEMLKGFRDFISRGNVVELAVAVVVGAAFTALVTAMVEDLLTPVIAAIIGEPDFSDLTFTVNGSIFRYGNFINAVITFLTVVLAIYFMVVVPLGKLSEIRERNEDSTTKTCPECRSDIPVEARRCAHCTVELRPGLPPDAA